MWEEEPKAPVKTTSMKNEARIARRLGGTLTPGSGNQHWPSKKGDISHPLILFEAKETEKSTITVNEAVVGKIYREAGNVGKHPALILSAYGMRDPLPRDWVCVPLALFEDMLRVYGESQ